MSNKSLGQTAETVIQSTSTLQIHSISGDQLIFLKRNPAALRVYLILVSKPDLTVVGLSDIGNRNKSSIGRVIRKLRDMKLIHISGWERGEITDGDAAPKYRIGNRPDKPKPKRKSKSEIFKDYWEKNRERHTIPKLTGERRKATPWTGLIR